MSGAGCRTSALGVKAEPHWGQPVAESASRVWQRVDPGIKRSLAGMGRGQPGNVSSSPSLVSKGLFSGPSIPSFPVPGKHKPEQRSWGLNLLWKPKSGLALAKKQLKATGGLPGPTGEQVHQDRIHHWAVVANLLAHGRSIWSPLSHCPIWGRHETSYTALLWEEEKLGRCSETLLPSGSPLHVLAEASWTPEGAVAPAHSPKATFPKDSKLQSNSSEGPANTANRHKVGNDPENGNYVLLLTPSCHWWFTSFSGGKKIELLLC